MEFRFFCPSCGQKLKAEPRSEEHTSELQSRRDLVCRLLLAPPIPVTYPLSLHDALPISCLTLRVSVRERYYVSDSRRILSLCQLSPFWYSFSTSRRPITSHYGISIFLPILRSETEGRAKIGRAHV